MKSILYMVLPIYLCSSLPLSVLLVHLLSSLFLFLISHTGWRWMTATGFTWTVHTMLETFPCCHTPFCSCVEDTPGFSLCSRISFTHQSHPRPASPALTFSYSVSISSLCKWSPACGGYSLPCSSWFPYQSTHPFSYCTKILTHIFCPLLISSLNYFHFLRCFVKLPLVPVSALSCRLAVRYSFQSQQYNLFLKKILLLFTWFILNT